MNGIEITSSTYLLNLLRISLFLTCLLSIVSTFEFIIVFLEYFQGCCDVVLDQDELLANESANLISHHAFRKTVHHLPEEHSMCFTSDFVLSHFY